MTSASGFDGTAVAWRDDIATPVDSARLGRLLLDPREAYSEPSRLGRHLCLSPDEKRVILAAWLRGLLEDGHEGEPLSVEVLAAMAELSALDPGAAAVFRRAFAAQHRAATF